MSPGPQRTHLLDHTHRPGGSHLILAADIEASLQAIFGESAEPFLRDAVARADGRFRKRLFEAARAGKGENDDEDEHDSGTRTKAGWETDGETTTNVEH